MIQSSKAIVLHHIKYKETSVIAYMYTERNGRIAFIISGMKGKKSPVKFAMLQPLTLVNIEFYFNPKKELHRIKDLKIDSPFSSIPFNFTKSTISLFIAEFLYKTLKEEEPNSTLFQYLYQSILYFDLMEERVSDFHLLFLSHLAKHLGFYPHNNYTKSRCYFDIIKGEFCNNEPMHNHYMSGNIAYFFSKTLESSLSKGVLLNINAEMRQELLFKLLDFYQVHLDKNLDIKSISIFKDLFHK